MTTGEAKSAVRWKGNPAAEPLLVPLADLRPDPRNARTHSPRNLSAIATSLRRFGQQKPVVAEADGTVRAGSGLLAAAKMVGWTHIAVLRTDLSGRELTAYALADNQTATLAGWDRDALAALIMELDPLYCDVIVQRYEKFTGKKAQLEKKSL